MKGIKVLQIFSILLCACIAYYVYELSKDVKQVGTVVSAKLNSSTITDEDVIEAAKKAALQTDFNCNFDAPDTQQGTITYTYKKK